MPRAFAFPLSVLACAALLGTGAWLIHGEGTAAATPGVAAAAALEGSRDGARLVIPPPRSGFDPGNTDYGPPPGVIDPPAGHAGRRVAMDAAAPLPGSD